MNAVKFHCISEGHAASRAFLHYADELGLKSLHQKDIVACVDVGHYTSGMVFFQFIQLEDKLAVKVGH